MPLIRIQLTPEGRATIQRHADRPRKLREALSAALKQGLNETEAHLQSKLLRGGSPNEARGGRTPLAVRSGALLGSTRSALENALSGFVGAGVGAAAKYARVLLGDRDTVITPKSANHLWIPIGQNLSRSGQPRLSPREAMEKRGPRGGRLLRIFRSKAGNLIAALPGTVALSGVRNKRLRLMFVLKKMVTVKGTDALGKAVNDMRPRIGDLLQNALGSLDDGGVT